MLSELQNRSALLRIDSIRATTKAGSGHPTSCMSAAEIIATLYFRVMQFDPKNWDSQNNDRLILSKGHAAPVMYAAWKQLGLISDDELMSLRSLWSPLEGHPTRSLIMGEAATGSLGQGLAIGAGMAKTGCRCFVVMGDGEMSEGSVWEAAGFASHYKLNNLTAIIDYNELGQTGTPAYTASECESRFSAFGWKTFLADGHDVEALTQALTTNSKNPKLIIAKTIKGKGYSKIEGKNGFHGKALSPEQAEEAINAILSAAKSCKEKNIVAPPIKPQGRKTRETNIKLEKIPNTPIATREAFGKALCDLGKGDNSVHVLDSDVGNSTYTGLFQKNFPDRFTQCFIAEQTMIGVACGMESRGKIPFAATFSAFMTRAHDQLRMAAIGKHALRLSGSHSGVSIGQDGPSQMGLDDIAMIRGLPNSVVLYPCDAISTYKLVEAQANYNNGISYIRTTRMTTPIIYGDDEKFEIGGLKVLKKSDHDQLVIVAAGITVHKALKAHKILSQEGINAAVIDLYSVKPMDTQQLIDLAKKSGNKILTVEDHYGAGGIGEAVAVEVAEYGISVYTNAVVELPGSGKPDELMRVAGIDSDSIVKLSKDVL